MNTLSPPPSTGRQVRCWCGNTHLEDFSPDYWRCAECQTLVVREMRGEEISQVRDDDQDFYGKNYYLHHIQEDYGLPDLETRARADLPERCLHWLRAVLKFIPGPGARTLELGCGHGGFVAMQRWSGLDATGLELSPWLVRQARTLFDVPVLEGRLEDQELAARSWDAVVLFDVLEHLPDPRQTLGLAVSLLRTPESFLLIQTPCYPAGRSYEELLAADHPFLQQLKPVEHLYLYSEQAVARLCAELGVGQVRFEPAIFAHYDLFAVASAAPLRAHTLPERAEMLLAATPPAREALALLDLGEARDDLHARLAALSAEKDTLQAATADLWPRLDAAENARNLSAAQLADLRRHFENVASDSAERLAVIERQGAEIGRLHAEVDQQLKAAAEFWPTLDVAVNERNLLAAQIEDLGAQFMQGEADRTNRLQVIEAQGAEIIRLHAEVDRWLKAAGELAPKLEKTTHERNLRAAELADLRGHFEHGEADRTARLQVIETQGAEIVRLHAEVDRWLKTAGELAPKLEAALHERNLRAAELADLRGHFEHGQADRAARLQVIETQGAELGELRAQFAATDSELAALYGHYERGEADRAARLEVIERQGRELSQLQAQLASAGDEATRLQTRLIDLQAHLAELETDRVARLETIETQGAQIGRLDAQVAVAGNDLKDLRGQLEDSEADRAARLKLIGDQGAEIGWLRGLLDTANDERARLAAEADEIRASRTALTDELEAARTRRRTLEAHWAARLLKRVGLGPR